MTRILAILSTSFALGLPAGCSQARGATSLCSAPATRHRASGRRQCGQRAAAATAGGPGPRFRSDRLVTQRPAFRFLCRQPLGRAGTRSHRKVMLDALRATGAFSAVFDDSAPYAPVYNLRCGLRRFESDYTCGRSRSHVYVAPRLHARAAPRSRAARQLHGAGIVGSRRGSSQRGGRGIRSGNGDRHEAGTRFGVDAIAAEKPPSESR